MNHRTDATEATARAGAGGLARLRALGPYVTAGAALGLLALAMQLRSPLLLKVRAPGSVAAVAAALLLGEPPTLRLAVAGAAVLAGIAIATRTKARPPRPS